MGALAPAGLGTSAALSPKGRFGSSWIRHQRSSEPKVGALAPAGLGPSAAFQWPKKILAPLDLELNLLAVEGAVDLEEAWIAGKGLVEGVERKPNP